MNILVIRLDSERSLYVQSTWEPMLTKLAARYLLTEKRRKYALDPVANFHLRNGAEVFRLNYLVRLLYHQIFLSNRDLKRSSGLSAHGSACDCLPCQ